VATAGGIALLATACLTGCGSAPAPGGGTPATVPAAQSTVPSGGQRAAATSDARKLLAGLRLPDTAHGASWPAAPPRSLRPMLPAGLKLIVDLRKLYRRVAHYARDGWLIAHVPAGLTTGSSGQAGNARTPGATAYYVSYNPRVLPRGIYEATLAAAVIPARGGGSLLRVDAQVAWYPPRSAAEHIYPHGYRAVIVTAPRRYGGTGPMVARTISSGAVVTRLAAGERVPPCLTS
jgi:hypothetical protein